MCRWFDEELIEYRKENMFSGLTAAYSHSIVSLPDMMR